MNTITSTEIMKMIDHWLQTPQDGYLGSDYGNNLKEVLQTPHAAGLANAQVKKLIRDVPILSILPRSSINLYTVDVPPDKVYILIDVYGMQFTFTGE